MFFYTFYRRYLWVLKIIAFFFMGLCAAFVIALHQINLESLRGNILSVLRDATNLPVEIDGKISWHFSLRPEIELNNVRIPNAEWAENKNLFSAKKIDVRLDLISLFGSRPVIRYIKVYDAKVFIEKNENGEISVDMDKTQTPEKQPYTSKSDIEKYPFKKLPFGGLEIQKLSLAMYGDKYEFSSFGIHSHSRNSNIEYSGWVKSHGSNLPFIIKFSEYNSERKVYPVRIAFATGGDTLIADVALEGTSKLPIDFVVRGEIPNLRKSGDWFNIKMGHFPKIKLNIVGGMDRKKISFRNSSVGVDSSVLNFSGTYDWSKTTPVIDMKITSDGINLYKTFPEWFNVGKEWIHPNRDLDVFHDMPLFGQYLYGIDGKLDIKFKHLIVYHSLDLSDLNMDLVLKNHKLDMSVKTGIAGGNIDIAMKGDINQDGVYNLTAAANGSDVYVGNILKEIDVKNIISGLPMNIELCVRAHGSNMSEIMQTITGPVMVYSTDKGFAHSDLVEYMYGGDFLTSLRHNVEDLFTGNKRDMIEISKAIANVKIRDGLIETRNGVAVESHVVNLRLAGTLDLGKEQIQMSLASVPVRGLKLSLTGNLVNAMQISGNLAEPDFKISGAAVAGKVGSAVGIGLLLAPLTGGLSLAVGSVAGLLAGDLLEGWLADDKPYKTAMDKGAPAKRDDPEWLNKPIKELTLEMFQ